MSAAAKLQACIDQIIIALSDAKVALGELTGPVMHVQAVQEPPTDTPPAPIAATTPPETVPQIASPATFDDLRNAVMSDSWPTAVNPRLIVDPNNVSAKEERGRGIIDLMVETDLEDTRMLDFGCGEGFSTRYAATKSCHAVGYDIQEFDTWASCQESTIFTTNWEKVVANGPYDVILCFDVIDHLVGTSAIASLKQMAKVLTPAGKIYMRTHPLTSRHASHLYHSLNKAYLHLVFSDNELQQLVPSAKHSVPNTGNVRTPLITYESMIKNADLQIVTTSPTKEAPDEFFKTPAIADRIIKNLSINKNFPEFQMSLSFIDYVLQHA